MRNVFFLCMMLMLQTGIFQTLFAQNSNNSKAFSTEKQKALNTVLQKTVDNKKIYGASFALQYKGEQWSGAAGNLSAEQPYFIASTTKLFVTTVILQLRSEGKLDLDDPISRYLEAGILKGLHVYKGRDYSAEITIRQLLAHTSGLPDYFSDKNKSGVSLESELLQGKDRHWTFEEAIAISKTLEPHFSPGSAKKAYYSDTNFQLLGRIIEQISGKSLTVNFEERIFRPLELHNTYLYTDASDKTPKTLNYKNHELPIPQAMTSFGADGGMVSTNSDMLAFTEAFFSGKLFPQTYLPELQQWNKIFSPLESGIGIHRFKMPRFLGVPELIGHSGLSGALAYYAPEKDLYIVGTVNQVAYPQTSFKTAVKLMQRAMK